MRKRRKCSRKKTRKKRSTKRRKTKRRRSMPPYLAQENGSPRSFQSSGWAESTQNQGARGQGLQTFFF